MTRSDLTFEFMAPVLRLETGLRQHYVPLPTDISDALVDAGVRRVLATLNGHTVSRGIQGRKDGERHLLVGKPILKEMGAGYGDLIPVRLEPDPDPDTIEIPDEFRTVLEQDPEAAERFFDMTPGKQRGLAYYVDSAKREETRVRRALKMAELLRTYSLYGDRSADDG